jgi:glycosyltransferase involved in cell wall biosynthesis
MIPVQPCGAPTTDTPTVVFLASGNSVNQDALDFLVSDIWPRIRQANGAAVLEVYGRVCSHAKAAGDDVRIMGEIEDVAEAYRRAWVVVSPLRFGTGLKIKSVEALGYGKALVCTPAGASGLESVAGTAFVRADSAKDFAAECAHLLGDFSARRRFERSANEFSCAWNRGQQAALEDVLALARVDHGRHPHPIMEPAPVPSLDFGPADGVITR